MAKSSDSKPENIGSNPVSSATLYLKSLLDYKEFFYYIVSVMMIDQSTVNQDEEKVTFATNWFDTVNDIFQLSISDYIWQTKGFDYDEFAQIKKVINGNNTIIEDSETGHAIGGYYFNPEKATWIFYANERYTG